MWLQTAQPESKCLPMLCAEEAGTERAQAKQSVKSPSLKQLRAEDVSSGDSLGSCVPLKTIHNLAACGKLWHVV